MSAEPSSGLVRLRPVMTILCAVPWWCFVRLVLMCVCADLDGSIWLRIYGFIAYMRIPDFHPQTSRMGRECGSRVRRKQSRALPGRQKRGQLWSCGSAPGLRFAAPADGADCRREPHRLMALPNGVAESRLGHLATGRGLVRLSCTTRALVPFYSGGCLGPDDMTPGDFEQALDSISAKHQG